MRLTWQTGYEDYTDSENWLPRLEVLRATFSSISLPSASTLSDNALLDTMEDVEELMRYYCAVNDMVQLEPVMRKMNDLLQLCKERNICSVGAVYLEMVFSRMNAMLYRANKQNRQSAEFYQQTVALAKHCFTLLQAVPGLNNEQILYVGWNCVECGKEAAETSDNLLTASHTKQYFLDLLPMLTWLEPYLADAYGIMDKMAELYATIGGYLYMQKDSGVGAQCYQQAIDLFNRIDRQGGSDFYRARAIWTMCGYGTMESVYAGNFRVLQQCKAEADSYIQERRGATDRELAIIHSCQAMADIQYGTALQQSGQTEDAIRTVKPACDRLGSAFAVLTNYLDECTGGSHSILSPITARLYNSYLGAMETLGVMYYQNNQAEKSEKTLIAALDLLNNNKAFTMGESSAILIRAEICQYMALLASDKGDIFQIEFYGTQAADQAFQFCQQTCHPGALNIAAISCSLVAEACLAAKNKSKAGTYAQQGVTACQQLAQLNSQLYNPDLQHLLEKFCKKAARKFF